MALFRMSVTSGVSGPVLMLSGESDVSTATELTAAFSMQVAAGFRHLTVDLCDLSFADPASAQAFVQADRALKAGGGTLELVGRRTASPRVRIAFTIPLPSARPPHLPRNDSQPLLSPVQAITMRPFLAWPRTARYPHPLP